MYGNITIWHCNSCLFYLQHLFSTWWRVGGWRVTLHLFPFIPSTWGWVRIFVRVGRVVNIEEWWVWRVSLHLPYPSLPHPLSPSQPTPIHIPGYPLHQLGENGGLGEDRVGRVKLIPQSDWAYDQCMTSIRPIFTCNHHTIVMWWCHQSCLLSINHMKLSIITNAKSFAN